MKVSLVTLGDPARQTGGYLYHRRLAAAAPDHGAEVRFVSFPDRAFPLGLGAGRRVLQDAAAADVVVIDSIAVAFAAPWLGRVRTPLVGMLHQGAGGIDHGAFRTRIQAVLDRFAYRRMRVLLVASESLHRELSRLHPDVRVVAPGRDVAVAASGEPMDLRRGRRAAFLCVGNWVPRKGIVDLLDAIGMLPDDIGTLHLVGDTESDPRYATEVLRRAGRLGDRVVVHGIVPKERVAAFYRDADVFVMPSTKEPYGTAYGEAMAAGIPVVGWRAGNLPFLARDEREGVIVEPGDIRGLAAALRRLADDEELRGAMGAAARRRAAEFPTWDDTATTFFMTLRAVAAIEPKASGAAP